MRFKWLFSLKGVEIPTLGVIIFTIVLVWSLGMILAPLSLPANSVKDLSGEVGTIDNADITKDMNPYAKFYYEAGDFNCHTIKERSFFINGNQMPFCARDVAIFFGMALGLGIALFKTIELKLWWLIGGLIPIGVDGTLQLFTSYESNNALRLITGLLAGFVTTFALGYVIYDTSKMAEERRKAKLSSFEHEMMMEEPIQEEGYRTSTPESNVDNEKKLQDVEQETKTQ